MFTDTRDRAVPASSILGLESALIESKVDNFERILKNSASVSGCFS